MDYAGNGPWRKLVSDVFEQVADKLNIKFKPETGEWEFAGEVIEAMAGLDFDFTLKLQTDCRTYACFSRGAVHGEFGFGEPHSPAQAIAKAALAALSEEE